MPRIPLGKTAYPDLALEREIGQALAAARHRAGMTQIQVAQALGTDQGNIARLEAGKVSPTLRTLQRYAEATGSRIRIAIEPID
jgi:transcriptional regulator with XRE-family HTH domain